MFPRVYGRTVAVVLGIAVICLGDGAARVSAADDDLETKWLVTAECEMIVVPQAAALELLPDLLDSGKIEAAYGRLREMVKKKEAELVGHLAAKGGTSETLKGKSVEEFQYPTGYFPPDVPYAVPSEKIAEVLKSWPIVAVTPAHFEIRELGAMMEVYASGVDNGWWDVRVTAEHVRLSGWSKYDVGRLPNGERLSVQQPRFLKLSSSAPVLVKSGERALFGSHMLPGEERKMELFLVKITAERKADSK